jgi:hypothetical protein
LSAPLRHAQTSTHSFAASTAEHPCASLAEHDLDTEPDCSEKARDDNADDCLEGVALSLLDALAPAPQMLEISTQLSAILFFHAERGENGRNRPENDRFDIVTMQSLLLGQGLGNDGPDVFVARHIHRLRFFATFSKPRLAKWKDTTRLAVVDANPESGSVVPKPRTLPDVSNLIENVGK